MGVLGLTTFINNNNKRLLDDHLLCDTSLVIDGNSLAVQLYQSVSQCNSAFGGDYDEYAKTVKSFFKYMSKCNINPYVVMDGGYEDKRMKTILKRLRCRIIDASRVNPKNQSQYLVLPIMFKDVFIEVLISLGVKYTVCEYEADNEIAAVARFLNCPVLSYDSDFFIYNVIYIPFPSLSLKPVPLKNEDKKSFGLKCKVFKIENFLKRFELNNDLVPLIGTLLGNDYVQRGVFSKFYHNLRVPKLKSRNEGQCRITGVIEWLKNETYESAVEKILNRFKITERDRIKRILFMSCTSYTRTNCMALNDLGLTEIPTPPVDDVHEVSETFDNEDDCEGSIDSSISDSSVETDDRGSCQIEEIKNKNTPPWLIQILKRGEISARYFDLLHMSLYIGSSQVQDISKVDADVCAWPILRFSFDIMFGFDGRKMFFEGRKNSCIKRSTINFSGYVPENYDANDPSPSQLLFFTFLEQTLDKSTIVNISNLPKKCQLFVLAIVWLKKSVLNQKNPSDAHIYSLLICFIMMSIIRAKIGSSETYFHFNSKFSTKFEEWREMSKESPVVATQGLLEKKVLYHDCMVAASKLLKYFEVDKKLLNSPRMFKNQYLHFFAQYQTCLQQLGYLNILTSRSLAPCSISKSYNGTFIYNFYSNLRSRDNPGAYIYQLLKSSPSVLNYFISLADFVGCGITLPENQTN